MKGKFWVLHIKKAQNSRVKNIKTKLVHQNDNLTTKHIADLKIAAESKMSKH